MNINQNNQQQPKKKKSVGVIILIVFACLLPIIILVAVMLMSLGVLLFNQSKDIVTVQTLTFDQIASDTYNSQFDSYLGESISKSSVSFLMDRVTQINGYETNTQRKMKVEILLKDGKTYSESSYNKSILNSMNKYDVSAEYGNDGYMSKITIVEK